LSKSGIRSPDSQASRGIILLIPGFPFKRY